MLCGGFLFKPYTMLKLRKTEEVLAHADQAAAILVIVGQTQISGMLA